MTTRQFQTESIRLLAERLPLHLLVSLNAVGQILDLAQLDEVQLADLMLDLTRRASKQAANIRFEKELRK